MNIHDATNEDQRKMRASINGVKLKDETPDQCYTRLAIEAGKTKDQYFLEKTGRTFADSVGEKATLVDEHETGLVREK